MCVTPLLITHRVNQHLLLLSAMVPCLKRQICETESESTEKERNLILTALGNGYLNPLDSLTGRKKLQSNLIQQTGKIQTLASQGKMSI